MVRKRHRWSTKKGRNWRRLDVWRRPSDGASISARLCKEKPYACSARKRLVVWTRGGKNDDGRAVGAFLFSEPRAAGCVARGGTTHRPTAYRWRNASSSAAFAAWELSFCNTQHARARFDNGLSRVDEKAGRCTANRCGRCACASQQHIITTTAGVQASRRLLPTPPHLSLARPFQALQPSMT